MIESGTHPREVCIVTSRDRGQAASPAIVGLGVVMSRYAGPLVPARFHGGPNLRPHANCQSTSYSHEYFVREIPGEPE